MHSRTDDNDARNLIIQGNIEALAQVSALLNKLSDAQYVETLSHCTESSIGQHTRHMLDIYLAVFQGLSEPDVLIDYDMRRRGSTIEINRSAGSEFIEQVMQQLRLLRDTPVWPCLSVSTEVLLSSRKSVKAASNLERELVFAASHTVHHLALMGVIAKLLGIAVNETIGVAPSTASFLRDQSAKV